MNILIIAGPNGAGKTTFVRGWDVFRPPWAGPQGDSGRASGPETPLR